MTFVPVSVVASSLNVSYGLRKDLCQYWEEGENGCSRHELSYLVDALIDSLERDEKLDGATNEIPETLVVVHAAFCRRQCSIRCSGFQHSSCS